MTAKPQEAPYADYYVVEEYRDRLSFAYVYHDGEEVPKRWSSPSSVSPGIELRFHHTQEAVAAEYARNLMQLSGNHTRGVACGATFRRVIAEFMPEVNAKADEEEE